MPLSIADAEKLITEFCTVYPIACRIPYKLRETQEEALDEPRATIEREGRIYGAYFPAGGYAAFAVSNFRDEAHFRRVVRHEILGHFGINTFNPEEKRALLETIIEARNQPGLRDTWAVVDRHYPGVSDLRKAEEVYAFSCEDIEPHVRTRVSPGAQALQHVCIERQRPLTFEDLINLTTMVAEGLHDRTRSQQTFPDSDSAQFKQDSPMKTSEYPVWLAVQPDEREKMRAAAGQLSDGRSAVAWDKEEKLWYARPGCDLDRINEWLPDRTMRAGGGDPEAEFLDVLTQAGLVIKGMPVMNGTRQRVATTDDKGGKNSGVYCGYLDRRPGGWFINYHRADSVKDVTNWSASGGEADPVARLHIRAAAKQSQEDSARQRAASYARQTRIATRLYDRLPAADPAHPYLVRKGIPPTPEIRQTRNGALVVPFFSAEGNFKSLQYIPASGDKRLFKGAPKKGNFLVIGGPLEPGQPILYAEGYATARSLNLATDRPVVMTIDAGNMVTVAQILHQQFPDSPHLFLADFDHAKDENKGLIMATEAAQQVGGQVLYPAFNESEIAQGFTDFNDLHQSRGLDAVRTQTAHLFAQLDEVSIMPDQQPLELTNNPSVIPGSEPDTTTVDMAVQPADVPATSASDTVADNTSTLEPPPVAATPLADNGPQPLNFTFSGQPVSLNLQDYQPGQLPEATVIQPVERVAPPMPNLTYNGQPARLQAQNAQDVLEPSSIATVIPEALQLVEPVTREASSELTRSGDVVATDPVPALAESSESPISAVLDDQADAALSDEPQKPAIQATPLLAPADSSLPVSAEVASQAQPAETPSDVKGLTVDQLQWAQSQPWFNGSGQDDDGAYVYAREQDGKQVQWIFRNVDELKIWGEKQLALNVQAEALPAARSSMTVDTAQPQTFADGIQVGPRIGQDVTPLQPSQIDKDNLLTRISHETRDDNSVLYKLDDQPAFVDRGSRLEMVPGAGQSDEKILAALLTAARFYRGQIELTGSDAFKAKAIELIAQNQVNVSMKNPAQQLMLDQARQALILPVAKVDAIHGETPAPFDPAPLAATAANVAAAAGTEVPFSPKIPDQPATPMPVNTAYAPLEASVLSQLVPTQSGPVDDAPPLGHAAQANPPSDLPNLVQSTPIPMQSESTDSAPAAGQTSKIDLALHTPSKQAEQGVTGKVLSCGPAPFRFDPQNKESVHIKLRTKSGIQTYWGRELAGLLRDTRIEPGRMATLQYLGEKPVTVNAPVKENGIVVRFEELQTHRDQWSMSLLNGPTVRTGDDQGVKMVAYDSARFAMIQNSIMAQLNVQIDAPALPADGLFWMTPNGQGSARAGDPLSAPRPAVDSVDVGKPVMSSWSPDGQLDMALFRGDGPYLQGVVRQGDNYQHVLVSLPNHDEAPPMVFNQITEQGLVPIGVGNGINRSGSESVAREHIAFKLDGDPAVRVGKLDFPAELSPALHDRLGFDQRWKDTSNLPKSSPAAAAVPVAQPSAARPA